jgi:hypothetical protein
MPLKMPAAPNESTRTLTDAFGTIKSLVWPSMQAETMDADTHIAHSHEVFTISLADVAAGAGLEKAQSVGWRHHLAALDQPVGAASVAAEVKLTGDGHAFTQLHRGWLSDATRRALTKTQKLRRVTHGEFEVRSLHLPALLIDALWMKDTRAQDDFLVPLASKGELLKVDRAYKPSLFFKRIRALAQRRLAFDDRPTVVA